MGGLVLRQSETHDSGRIKIFWRQNHGKEMQLAGGDKGRGLLSLRCGASQYDPAAHQAGLLNMGELTVLQHHMWK